VEPSNSSKEQHILRLALKGEETVNVELKVKYDLSTDKSELLRDVIALCNPMAEGGAENVAYLIIGGKNGQIFDTSQLQLDESDIRSIIHAYISPQVNFSFHIVEYQGNKIIGIEIVRTHDLYIVQKGLVTKKRRRVKGQEQEFDDILSAGECWIRQGTAKRQLDGQQIIAYQHRFFRKKLDDQFLPVYERIGQLESKVLAFEDAQPKLELYFDNGDTKMSVNLTRKFRRKEDWVKEKIELLRLEHPKIDPDNPKSSSKDAFATMILEMSQPWVMHRMTSEVVDKYNSELDIYYERLPNYAEKCYNYILAKRSSALIVIKLVNSGKCPAQDIDVELSLSPESAEHFCIKSAKVLRNMDPETPKPPSHPMRKRQAWLDIPPSIELPSIPNMFKKVTIANRKASSKRMRIADGKLICKLEKLKHGHHTVFKFALSLVEAGTSCNINYRITAENMSDELNGMLCVSNRVGK